MERVSAQCCCIPYTVIVIFDCNRNDLEVGRSWCQSKGPWVVSYLTSFESNISLAILEIFDIRRFFVEAMVRLIPLAVWQI